MNREILTEREANSYSPLTLAFLGDSVYDTLVRAKIKLVCAEFQSKAYDIVSEKLSEHETAILKRGRNATGNTVPKHADAAEYRRATALECLFGYLFLTGKNERVRELFEVIINSNIIENEQIGV